MPSLPNGIYEHYKGQRYQVFGTATHSESLELMVVYQPLYGMPSLWVRPLNMFTETVSLADGNRVPRFKLIEQSASPVPSQEAPQ